MSIKFTCPNPVCKKTFVVKDELAGKRTRCPACNQFLTVPAPIGAAADIEAFAAAALVEQPAEPIPVKDVGTIDFNCPQCDEPIKMSADLAGKQGPCPSCRRIIKVPLLKKEGPIDWRKADTRLPSAARRDDEPAPEGAWGTATSASVVSRTALEEAAAIPIRREPLTARQKIRYTTAAVIALLVLSGTGWWGYNTFTRNRQERALARAVAPVDEGKAEMPPEAAAEVHRAAGEYLLRAGKVEEAQARFQKARGLLANEKAASSERDLLLLDLALSQVDLGGDKAEVINKTHLKWDDTQKELLRTLQNVRSAEARAEALRAVSRKLFAKGQDQIPLILASTLGTPDDAQELAAVVGLEALRARREELAGKVVEGDLQRPAPPPAAPPVNEDDPEESAMAAAPSPSPSLIALCVALGKLDKIRALVPPKPKEANAEPDPAVRVGYAEGTARKGDLEAARRLASGPGAPAARLAALVAVAGVAVENGQTEAARPDVTAASEVLGGSGWDKPASPWLVFRLVRLGAQAGMADAVTKWARLIADPGLRGRAELEILRSRLTATRDPAGEELLEGFVKGTVAEALGREWLARHNARVGGSGDMQKTVDGWEPEWQRALGYAGLALGLQDAHPR